MKKFNTLLTYVSSNRIWLITLGCLDLFFAFLAWVAYPGDFLSLVGLMIFVSLGVNPQTAEVDACRMEHAVSDESFQKLKEHAMRGIAAQKIDNTFDNFPVKK